jgi:hypothetical protein
VRGSHVQPFQSRSGNGFGIEFREYGSGASSVHVLLGGHHLVLAGGVNLCDLGGTVPARLCIEERDLTRSRDYL